jgi:hypothetical protein
MRFLVILLAVLGLLANPVSAAAAQAACNHMTASASASASASMPGMDMPAMAKVHQDGVKKAADPCCDPGNGDSKKSCAQLCAAICAVDAAIEGPVVSAPFASKGADPTPARVAALHPFEPAGPERPPTHIA